MELSAETEPHEDKDLYHLAGGEQGQCSTRWALSVPESVAWTPQRPETRKSHAISPAAFSQHMGLDSIGALDAEGVDVIREGIIRA